MNWFKFFYRFQLNHNIFLHKQVNTKRLSYVLAFINQRKLHF